ncbi:AlpA family transcriptional regulator [Sulfitobacter sp. NFXS29]|uniref:helix-turn-helix transcriptional regulator n=1 Tax=Sulfitobacter sp. NFXS29 TaxID=2818438 RepID=UPI0032DE325A
MTDKILRCREVQEATGLSRSTIYRMMGRDDFPKATKLGVRAIGWRQSAVRNWIEGRINGN